MGAVADWVRSYRAAGLSVCRIAPGKKCPTAKGWPLHTAEAGDFGPADAVGILCGRANPFNGADLVCLDLDDRRACALAPERLPPTGWVEGRPGKRASHWWYLTTGVPPESEARGTLLGAGPRTVQFRGPDKKMILELKGTGAQCVVPPSPWGSGRAREARDWDRHGAPAAVPYPELLAACRALAAACGWVPPAPPPAVRVLSVYRPGENIDALFARAQKYLGRCPPAVSGQGGFRQTNHLAGQVAIAFPGLSADDLGVLMAEWNGRCSPPWPDGEIRKMIAHAVARTTAQGRRAAY